MFSKFFQLLKGVFFNFSLAISALWLYVWCDKHIEVEGTAGLSFPSCDLKAELVETILRQFTLFSHFASGVFFPDKKEEPSVIGAGTNGNVYWGTMLFT